MHILIRLVTTIAVLLFAANVSATTVIVDTGHTPARMGSTSAMGRPEYLFNVQLADAVSAQLQARGIRVVRVQGEYTLSQRTQNSQGADLFLSLHHDSIQQVFIDAGRRSEFSGFSVLVSKKNTAFGASLACARQVGQRLVMAGEQPSLYHAANIKGENRPLLDRPNGVHQFDDLVVLKTARAPAILVEAGVIANPDEDRRLGDPVVARKLAGAIVSGVVACLPKR